MNRIILSLKSKAGLLYSGSILIFLVIINYQALDTWFMVDDTACIFCSSLDPIKLLFDRGTYIYFNKLFFTPILPISLKLDFLIFKMNPIGYHLHNLLIAFLSCIVFYKFLRIYISSFFSWLGTVFLSISLPMSFDIGWITRKHYLLGFLFSLIAIYLFKKWEENKKSVFMFLSLLSTLLAFLCKEAYTILPAVVLVISSGSITDRLKKSIAYMVFLVIYLVWRIYMLDSIGGYSGSIQKSFSFLLHRWLFIPVDLSSNLVFPYFSFILVFLLFLLALYRFKVTIVLILLAFIVSAPYVFYPYGGFILASKELLFVAFISFTLAYTMYVYWVRQKRFVVAFLTIIFISALLGSFLKTKSGHEIVIKLSTLYEKASKDILTHRDERIIVISEHCYYFSNLRDIYKRMLKEKFPYMKAVSTAKVIPFLDSQDFDRVILGNNLSLKSDVSQSSVSIFEGQNANDFIEKNKKEFCGKKSLPVPAVNFIPSDDYLRIDIVDSREGTYLRCLYMESYVGCYPISKKYVFRFDKVKKFEKIDIIYLSEKGETSEPATFKLTQF